MKMKQLSPARAACAETLLARLPVEAQETVSKPNSIAFDDRDRHDAVLVRERRVIDRVVLDVQLLRRRARRPRRSARTSGVKPECGPDHRLARRSAAARDSARDCAAAPRSPRASARARWRRSRRRPRAGRSTARRRAAARADTSAPHSRQRSPRTWLMDHPPYRALQRGRHPARRVGADAAPAQTRAARIAGQAHPAPAAGQRVDRSAAGRRAARPDRSGT